MKYRVYRCQRCNCCFFPVRSDQQFCSKRCRIKYYREMGYYLADTVTKTCPVCGKHFETSRSRQIYCSAECRTISRRKK